MNEANPDAVILDEVEAAMPELPDVSQAPDPYAGQVIPMTEFVEDFADDLLESIRTLTPPVYTGARKPSRDAMLANLLRQPLPGQDDVIHAGCTLLVDRDEPACIYNGEMGTGKTMMAIATAAILAQEGFPRALVIAPPHLVYKWRREIKETVPEARVWVLNGPDTLRRLLQIREMRARPSVPEFFVLGRVRMRMGFHWRPAIGTRVLWQGEEGRGTATRCASCSSCGEILTKELGDAGEQPMSLEMARHELSEKRRFCSRCKAALWTLIHRGRSERSLRDLVTQALLQLPTIGAKRAEQLIARFGEKLLSSMLEDNLYEFVNLMDEDGDLVFNDRQATRLERALATFEYNVGQGGYQPTEFIKRYLPQGYFGLLVVDEGHEYKNEGSAQGQAMGVLARKCTKTLLLTGTLMGGYADDLFHLLWRLDPKAMVDDGFKPSTRGSMASASMAFMREHGVLKDIYKETGSRSHRTARGTSVTHRVAKAPGFGPKGVMRFVLPTTAFLKLKDLGANVLPPYEETFVDVPMTEEQEHAYRRLEGTLRAELRSALAKGDSTLLGVVLNALLAWPDCAFRDEMVKHPRTRSQLHFQRAIFADMAAAPKELELIGLCKAEKAAGRRVLVYTVYSGTRDTTARLKALLAAVGLKVAVLRATVEAAKREDWVFEQVERGVDVIVTNPDLVKTGLDLLEFPTIAFMQSGYNVYTLQQASRRSWRIGQKEAVKVVFFGYVGTAQIGCLTLMGQKIAVSQSTFGRHARLGPGRIEPGRRQHRSRIGEAVVALSGVEPLRASARRGSFSWARARAPRWHSIACGGGVRQNRATTRCLGRVIVAAAMDPVPAQKRFRAMVHGGNGRGAAVRARAQAVRPKHRRIPADAGQARRHVHDLAGVPRVRLRGRPGLRPRGSSAHAAEGCGGCDPVLGREGDVDGRRGDPGAGGQRLHQRIPHAAPLARRQAARDRRGDERDPADADRAGVVCGVDVGKHFATRNAYWREIATRAIQIHVPRPAVATCGYFWQAAACDHHTLGRYEQTAPPHRKTLVGRLRRFCRLSRLHQ